MTPVLVAIFALTIFGIPVVLSVDPRAHWLRVLGLSFPYGSGVVYLLMLVMSQWNLRWSRTTVAAGMLICWVVAWTIGLRRRDATRPHPAIEQRGNPLSFVFDAGTLLTVTGYAVYVTIAPLWQWDFWAIWGLKARVFLERGGIDWRFLESRWNAFAHPDYPLLLPMQYDFVALVGGDWSDRWLGFLFVAWGVALLLVVRELALRETTPLAASIITFALSPLAVSRYAGLAEGPLIVFGGVGVLLLRRALLFDEDAGWWHGAICLGFAASCKNEGLAMLATAIIATLVTARPRTRVIRLWPAIAIAAPWLLFRAAHSLANDIVGGSLMTRLAARMPQAMAIVSFLSTHLFEKLSWIALLTGIVVAPIAAKRRETFLLLFTSIQAAIYVGAYFVTPYDPRWHIVTSWPRLTGQIAVPIAFATMLILANSLRRAEDSPHAEARPQQ